MGDLILDPRILGRSDAGLKPPLPRGRTPFDLDRVEGFSLHDEGTTNVAKRWVTDEFHGLQAVQDWHMNGVVRRKDGTLAKKKWSDFAYSIGITRVGSPVAVRGLDLRPFAEGTVQRNSDYGWNWPDFCTVGESGNDYFISILLVHVGIATNTVKPYQFNGEMIAARKGQYVPPSTAQLETLDWLIPSLRDTCDRPDWGVWGHGGHRIKDCPGPHVWPEIQRGRWNPPKTARRRDRSGRFQASVTAPAKPAAAAAKPAEPTFDAEFNEAVELGITDGLNPFDPVTRAEAAVMARRAADIGAAA